MDEHMDITVEGLERQTTTTTTVLGAEQDHVLGAAHVVVDTRARSTRARVVGAAIE